MRILIMKKSDRSMIMSIALVMCGYWPIIFENIFADLL